jgi:hypothetical protein
MSTNIVQNTENEISNKNVYASAKKALSGLLGGIVCCLGRV